MLFQVSGVLNRKARSSYSVFQGLNKILLRFVIAYGKKNGAITEMDRRERKWAETKLILLSC